jgi:hypothetical protein
MKKKLFTVILFIVAILCYNNKSFAQQQTTTSNHITKEDSAAFTALVMYPDTIRLDIFELCEYPAAIVNIASLQKNSSSGFTDAIANYSKDEQENFWNLSRYPGLISDLAQGGKKSKEDIDKILVNYPDEIHATALKYGRDYYETLKKIDDLQSQTNSQFAQILSDYPPETQAAIKVLTQYPEIISLLNDHLSLTVRIGDHFKRDPQGIIHRMDSLNLAEARQNAEDAAAWKQDIQQNPDEASDLKSAANDYATENGYTQEEINIAPSPEYMANYTCNPYSYWFGYPTWYPYSYWYPYPYWFDCGFYYDAWGNMVIIGYPSYYFTNWYFYYPEHWHHYPHLGNSYINHYYGYGHDNDHGHDGDHGHGHRRIDGNDLIVQHWVKDNEAYLPKDFLTNSSNRPDVIKQIGQLNEDVQNEHKGETIAPAAKNQYFQKNSIKYPALSSNPQIKTVDENKSETTPEVIQQPIKQPPVKITQAVKTSTVTPKQNTVTPKQNTNTVTPKQQNTTYPKQYSTPSTNNFDNMNKAQEYHKEVWEETQPTVQPQYQSVPKTQQQEPMKQTPKEVPVKQQEQKSNTSPGKKK